MARVHPTALVESGARIADDVEIGAYTLVGPHVVIEAGTWIGPHVVLQGHTRVGRHNRIHAFCSIGGPPQDKKYAGEPTRLEIGDNNMIREYCTMNTGTVQDHGVTRVGSNNWVMAYVHIAHDCVVGDNTIFANNAQIAGHVVVGDWVILGGMTGVHQFVKIGAHAMTAGGTILVQDVPPYVLGAGNPSSARGMNVEGLRRRGFSAESIAALRRAYKTLYRDGLSLAQAIERIDAQIAEAPEHSQPLQLLAQFLRESERGILR
jgi:UDP-N-acetylglucosamine acyltransferase